MGLLVLVGCEIGNTKKMKLRYNFPSPIQKIDISINDTAGVENIWICPYTGPQHTLSIGPTF